MLLQCLLQDPSLARGFDDELLEEIQDGTLRELARALRDCVQDGVSPDPARIQAMLQEAKLGQKAAELMARMDEVGEEVDRICEDCLRRLRRKAVERKIHSLASQIEAARARNDEDRLRELEARRAQLVLEKKRLSIAASKG